MHLRFLCEKTCQEGNRVTSMQCECESCKKRPKYTLKQCYLVFATKYELIIQIALHAILLCLIHRDRERYVCSYQRYYYFRIFDRWGEIKISKNLEYN